MMTDERRIVRSVAVFQCSRFGEAADEFGPLFRARLQDESTDIRVSAAAALVRTNIDNEKGLEFLLDSLNSDDSDSRIEAAVMLGSLGSQADDAVNRLWRYIRHEDGSFAQQCRVAIQRIRDDDRTPLLPLNAARNRSKN